MENEEMDEWLDQIIAFHSNRYLEGPHFGSYHQDLWGSWSQLPYQYPAPLNFS